MLIKINGININYEKIGEGRPIILLNPNSKNTNCMNFIANKLKNDFTVYKFDRRCCGKSEKNCKLTYEDSAKDVYEFIKIMKLDKPIVLGSSGGGSVAINLAINYPDSISKLVLCSAVARMSVIKIPNYYKFLNKLPWFPGKKSADVFVKLNESTKDIEKSELNKIKVKTLIVNGGKKDIVPLEEAKYLNDNIENSKMLILENDNHFSYMINLKWYDKLKEFLNN